VSAALGSSRRAPGDLADAADVSAEAAAAGRSPGVFSRAFGRLAVPDRPLTSYYLVLGSSLLLLAMGLAMVLSTSTASALASGQPTYAEFEKQVIGAVAGLAVMLVAARLPPRVFRLAAYPLLALSVLGLILVVFRGRTVDGGERWVLVAGFPLQPSELAKLAFALWGADLLARKEKLGQLRDWRHLLIPLLPGAALIALLIMLGDDLGTTFILVVVLLALLWVIGTPGRLFAGLLALMAFVLLVLVVVAPYRLERITGFLDPQAHPLGSGMQELQGKIALGSGGPFGVGLGASRAKWGWVPNATTDYIFAILGEELGLLGTLCVTFLYGGLVYAGMRIARRVPDTFMRLAAAAATTWIAVQALVNIGAVIGLLPPIGVPLPLISEGLSSLLVTMLALGMLMAFARHEPGARDALAAAGPSLPRRALSWLGLDVRRR
jgi:cell division protein FtsW